MTPPRPRSDRPARRPRRLYGNSPTSAQSGPPWLPGSPATWAAITSDSCPRKLSSPWAPGRARPGCASGEGPRGPGLRGGGGARVAASRVKPEAAGTGAGRRRGGTGGTRSSGVPCPCWLTLSLLGPRSMLGRIQAQAFGFDETFRAYRKDEFVMVGNGECRVPGSPPSVELFPPRRRLLWTRRYLMTSFSLNLIVIKRETIHFKRNFSTSLHHNLAHLQYPAEKNFSVLESRSLSRESVSLLIGTSHLLILLPSFTTSFIY